MGCLGRVLKRLGLILGRLGASWERLGASWARLEASRARHVSPGAEFRQARSQVRKFGGLREQTIIKEKKDFLQKNYRDLRE